ncbi:MAG: hypothetical protein OSJ65_08160 [Bacilli bacterium]|nr:hypothetical protein [Bacilli bacterium]
MSDVTKFSLPESNSWYYKNGYLTIDLELFGKNLCAIFNEFIGEYYYFQKFTPTIKTDNNRPIWQQGEENRVLVIISPNLYDERSPQNYNKIRVAHMAYPGPQYLKSYTLQSKEYHSMFSKRPLKLAETDFLLYFGKSVCEQVNLGYVENGQFIPTSDFRTKKVLEIEYTNSQYSLVEDFIKEIFNYKIVNKKPILDQNDMNIVLEQLGISREYKLHELVGVLKSMQEEAIEKLLRSSKVGKTLNLKNVKKNK